jgi:hypothetical protein
VASRKAQLRESGSATCSDCGAVIYGTTEGKGLRSLVSLGVWAIDTRGSVAPSGKRRAYSPKVARSTGTDVLFPSRG